MRSSAAYQAPVFSPKGTAIEVSIPIRLAHPHAESRRSDGLYPGVRQRAANPEGAPEGESGGGPGDRHLCP